MTKHLACKTAKIRERAQRNFGLGSLLLTFILMQQLQQLAIRENGGHFGVAATPIPHNNNNNNNNNNKSNSNSNNKYNNNSTLRLKRYSDIPFKERFQLALNSTVLDWRNTCGSATYEMVETKTNPTIIKVHKKRQKLLRIMQNETRFEYKDFIGDDLRRSVSLAITDKANDNLKAFDYRDINSTIWAHHIGYYKQFLPRIDQQKSRSRHNEFRLKLPNVHRDLEFYVAAFSYLRHAQLLADFKNSNYESVLSADLERLRLTARSVLCIVNTTIMEINRLARTEKGKRSKIHKIPLKTTGKRNMEIGLKKFKTNVVALHNLAKLVAKDESISLPNVPTQLDYDVRFAKYYYIKYVHDLIQLLKQQRAVWNSRKVKPTINESNSNKQQQQKQQKRKPKVQS